MARHLVFPHLPAHLQSVHHGHHHVRYNRIGHNLPCFLHAFLSVGGFVYHVFVSHALRNVVGQVGIVLHHQNPAVVFPAFRWLLLFRLSLLRHHRTGIFPLVVAHVRCLLVAYGQRQVERGALAHGALHAHSAVQRAHNLLHQCQPYSRSARARFLIGLVERLEEVRNIVLGNAYARVGHVDAQVFPALAVHYHAHAAILRSEFQCVRYQIAHHLAHVVGHEVGLKVGIPRHELQFDVSLLGIFPESLHRHLQVGGYVAVAPFGRADGRLHLRYVQQLVDEREQPLSLPLYGFPRAVCRVCRDRWLLQVLAQPQYYGERRAKLVRHVGEEVLPRL